ncbi:MAG: B12-binding domain-containing radical SAM protein [Deltaproteobacteria bacterium]|nr:B12-binding domain-containing radical SAM protein [Deltaproteobacteria bacterium]
MTHKKRILLVNPRCPADFLNTSVINEAMGKSGFFPSLSLLTVAALVPDDAFTVEVFDEVLGVPLERAGIEADIYALTCFNPNRERAHELCRWLKARGKFVVLGGPHCTHHWRDIAAAEPYDALFAGDAERTWPRFLGEWLAGRHERFYIEEEKLDLALTPVARWDLCPADRYVTAVIQTSRGCPFHCEFCDAVVLYGNKVRTKPAERVLEELERVYRAGFQSVLIGDDNFTAKRAYAKDVLRRIAAWRKDKDPLFVIGAQLSIDIARDDELLALMARAGLVFAYVGIESSSKDALREANKPQNLHVDIPAAVRKIHSYGITIMSGLIVGFDGDGPAIFGDHVDFCNELALPVCNTYLLTAPYGTPLRARLLAEGRLDADGDHSLGEMLRTNVIPKRLSPADMLDGFRWMTTQLFDYDAFGRRLARKFDGFRSRDVAMEGRTTWAVRARHYQLAWRILSFTLRHPDTARELKELLKRALPVMARHPRFINDIFQDLMIFIRFKSYYEQAGAVRPELLRAPRPETWMRERGHAAPAARDPVARAAGSPGR